MKTKILVPAIAALAGGYFLYRHMAAQKAHAAAVSVAAANANAAPTPAPSTINGLGGSPFTSHLQPMPTPRAFWSAGGWVGDTVTKPGRNYNVYPQVAPNIVDAYIGAGGTAIVGVAPPGAQQVKVMVDNSGTVLQVLASKWKTSDNVAGLGGGPNLKFNLARVARNATPLTKGSTTATLAQAKSLALPKAHAALLQDPTVARNIAVAVATTGAAHLVGSHIAVDGSLQAGPGAKEVTALTDSQGHVLATYATKSGQTAQAGWTSFVAAPGTPSAQLNGLGALGFSFHKAISAAAQTVAAPLKITVATLKTAVAPAAALVTLVKTGSVSDATATLKTDLTAVPTAGKSIASNLISTAKQATAPSAAKPAATGVTATAAASGTLPGDPVGATWAVDPTTASGWPGVWTNNPTQQGWQYGDVGDGTGDGLLQNVGLQVSFTATPAMISAAGGNPDTVVAQYLSANPTAAGATGTINPATGLPYTTTTTTQGSAQSYGWPTTWTLVPNNTAYQYMAAQDGTGNGVFMNPTTGQQYTATPSQILAYGGVAASVLASLLSSSGVTSASTAGSAQSYGWPAYWTVVPTNTTWQYMATQDGSGNGSFQNTATGQTFSATPSMIQAAGGVAGTVLLNYLNGMSATGVPYGSDGGYGDDDTGSGLTDPEVDSSGNPIDPSTGLPQTGVDANGNPIDASGGAPGALPGGNVPMPTPAAPAKKVNWMYAGAAALAVPAFMYFKR